MKWLEYLMRLNGFSELYDFQKEACEYIEKGYNVVVSAPTGSGKTFIAEYGIVYGVKRLKKKVVYVAPLRSLVYEKAREFSKLDDLNIDVVPVTGELWVYEKEVDIADVVVTTIEKLNSIVRHNPKFLDDVGVLIVDEVHMIVESERGALLEQLITESKMKGIQVIGLSATVGNLEELAHWLDAELVVSEERMVRLRYGVFAGGRLEWVDGEVEELDKDWIRALVLPVVEMGKNVLIFVPRRSDAENIARKVALLLPDSGERSKYREFDGLIEKGVAYHHAGLLKSRRMYVEELFRQRRIKVLVATTTLAMGVNLPAYRVIIKGVVKYDNNGYRYYTLNEIKQMMGRAGRPKYDDRGEAIIVVMKRDLVDFVKRKYLRHVNEALYSRLVEELSESILRHVVLLGEASREDIEKFLRETFAYYLNGDFVFKLDDVIEKLVYNLLLDVDGDKVVPTEFGRVVAELGISVPTAILIKKNVSSIADIIDLLGLIVSVREVPKVSVSKDERDRIEIMSSSYKVPRFRINDGVDYWSLLKTYMMLVDWISGERVDKIVAKFGVSRMDFDEIVQNATWVAHAVYRIAKVIGSGRANEFKKMRDRIENGATESMLDLMMIDRLTREDALLLVRKGFRSKEELLKYSPRELISRRVPAKIVAKVFDVDVERLKNLEKYSMLDDWIRR